MPKSKIEKEIADALVHLKQDRIMQSVIEEIDPYEFPKPTGMVYEDLIEAIVYQQVSIRAAKTIFERMLHHFNGMVPSPGVILDTPVEVFRGFGFSFQKARYTHNIAAFFNENGYVNEHFVTQTDNEILDSLTRIKGVGTWTVEMILISSLRRPDVFPKADLGIQQAMQELYSLSEEKKTLLNEMDQIASNWEPYRTFASLLLWRWKRKQKGLSY